MRRLAIELGLGEVALHRGSLLVVVVSHATHELGGSVLDDASDFRREFVDRRTILLFLEWRKVLITKHFISIIIYNR